MGQQYIFPAILYKDEENNNYALAFNDIDVFTEGETVEDAFKSAKDYLFAYLKCSMHVNGEIEEATSYIVVKDEHKAEIVLLVDANLEENNNSEDIDESFIDDIFEE